MVTDRIFLLFYLKFGSFFNFKTIFDDYATTIYYLEVPILNRHRPHILIRHNVITNMGFVCNENMITFKLLILNVLLIVDIYNKWNKSRFCNAYSVEPSVPLPADRV